MKQFLKQAYFAQKFLFCGGQHLYQVEQQLPFFLFIGIGTMSLAGLTQGESFPAKQLTEYLLLCQFQVGRQGETFGGFMPCPDYAQIQNCFKFSNITITMGSLVTLRLVGDDLTRVNKQAILRTVKLFNDLNYPITQFSTELDLRSVLACLNICKIFKDFSPIQQDKVTQIILNSINFDGGFGFRPGEQSHAAACYCAVASLATIDKTSLLTMQQKQNLVFWLSSRQVMKKQSSDFGGIQSRSFKAADSCYGFWVGATLQLLNLDSCIDKKALLEFLEGCRDPTNGAIKKYWGPSGRADIVHSHFGVLGSLIASDRTQDLDLCFATMSIK